MAEYFDKNNTKIENNDIIDIGQTVNGENKFIVVDIANQDVRYFRNPGIKYEYDVHELLSVASLFGETEVEIVGKYNAILPEINTETERY